MIKRLFIAIILLCFALPVMAGTITIGKKKAGGACSSGTADITQSTTDTDYGGVGVMGQSFTPTTNITIYSFTVYGGVDTSGTLTCRLGAGIDLSVTYLEEVTGISATNAAVEVAFPAHSALTAGTQYSVICTVTSGTWNCPMALTDVYQTDNEVYTQLYGDAGDWSPTQYVTRDIKFILKKCD